MPYLKKYLWNVQAISKSEFMSKIVNPTTIFVSVYFFHNIQYDIMLKII